MAISTSNTFLFTTGPIKFSDLRSSFKEVSSGPITATELLRNTTVTASAETNPIVPDAVENTQIANSTTKNLKSSQFRNSIKYYNLVQTGTDDNAADFTKPGVNIAEQNWFNNLGKNIKKRFYVQGTIGSYKTEQPAAKFDSLAYNLSVIIQNGGKIHGAGGVAGTVYVTAGATGGNALYATSTGYAVKVVLDPGSQVYGGGAGGARGSQGVTGAPGTCYYTYEHSYCNPGPNGDCPSGGSKIGNGPGGGTAHCCEFQGGGCNQARWRNICAIYYSVPGAPGGQGGQGGVGQGYLQSASAGLTGGSGTAGGCPNYGGTGYAGEPGAAGALFGGASAKTTTAATSTLVGNGGPAGTAGRAIAPPLGNYIYTGELTTETIKGLYQ